MARQATKRRKADDPDEAFVSVTLNLKRPVYEQLRVTAERQHRRISDQIRAFTLDGLNRTDLQLTTNGR